jgi:two-component system, LytTR family, response regulator
MLRTLIIDDEAHIRDTLTRMLARHCPQVSVVGEASGVTEGVNAIRDLHPELVLLDIHLGDGTGFDLIHAIGEINFKLIFISAFDKDLIQSFRLSMVEYLLKPVGSIELVTAVRNVTVLKQEFLILQLKALYENVRTILE